MRKRNRRKRTDRTNKKMGKSRVGGGTKERKKM